MKKILLITLLFLSAKTLAQDSVSTESDTIKIWKTNGIIGLLFTQVGLTNWAGGGESALSAVGTFRLNAIYNKNKITWENYFLTSYGLQKLGDDQARKNEDKIEIISKLGRKISDKWLVTGNLNFRTQWYEGFKSKEDSVKFSDFFAPAYLTLGIGFDYKPNDNFALFLSPATTKFTFVLDDFLSSQGVFGLDPGKKSRTEFGGFIKLLYIKENILKNVNFTTNLDLFSNYFENPEKIDVNWEVIIDMKINDFLTASINTYLIYDYDVKFIEIQDGREVERDKVQFKEALSVGLTYNF